ncbi:GSU2403 family nucleotidyltransferase fold protein, partial [Mesorhizobium sp. M7A.F.Ca.CA.001.09.1.1]
VLLHRSGVPVLVPSPERYAVHKLIVASLRQANANGAAKREKDVLQASLLVEAMATARRQDDLAVVFSEAWNRGASWRDAIQRGLRLLDPDRQDTVETIVRRALSDIGEELDGFTDATRRAD